MPLPGQKMYVVTKPELIQSAQKQHRTLAFPPVAAQFASRICGASAEARAILSENVNGDEGDFGLYADSHEGVKAALKPGLALDDMNRVMIQEIARALDLLLPLEKASARFNMYDWLRNAITTATTRSVYGPMNPFEDKAVADAFWYANTSGAWLCDPPPKR